MTKLAASILVSSLDSALSDAAQAAEFGADLVEYRLDRLGATPTVAGTLVAESALPCIITSRPDWEGGYFDGEEADRLSLFEHACEGPRQPAYLDLELAAWRSPEVRQRIGALIAGQSRDPASGPGLILSSHDYEARPRDLLRRFEQIAGEPQCRVVKLAWRGRSLRDNLEAIELIQQQVKPTIALCMGEFGLPSRVLARKAGALISFAALRPEQATASGQPTIDEVKRTYRWDALNPSTAVYGVIGYPVGHSMSPPLHNAGFEAIGHDGVYLPLPIHAEYEQLKATLGSWLDQPGLDFRGASVTIPHKQNLLRFVADQGGTIEPLTAEIGAANTLAKRDDGSLHACNTDYAAALDAVCARMGIEREALNGKRVAVLGAGGAARAVVAGFARYGARVVVYNRTEEKARQLAEAFNGQTGQVVTAPLHKLCDSCCQIYINCTPIGMHPDTDASPLAETDRPVRGWREGPVVFDTIYNPQRTRFLAEAEAAGCQTVSGVEMFIRQAAAQFELWTDQPAPLDRFRELMTRAT
jgi:3-dehydroquinate dehydratase/shikimate dehydrogenase